MTNEDIVNSQAFKVINQLIDTKAAELKRLGGLLKRRVAEVFSEDAVHCGIRVRCSYEVTTAIPSQTETDLGFDINDMRRLTEIPQEILRLKQEINELMSFKLRLLNDYDFTHGDPSEQIKMFGEAVTA
jgi:hypothetical protein